MPKTKPRPTVPPVPIGNPAGLKSRQLKTGPKHPKVGLGWRAHWHLIAVILLAAAAGIVWWLAVSA